MGGGPNNPELAVVGVVADVRHELHADAVPPRFYLLQPHFSGATGFGPVRYLNFLISGEAARASCSARHRMSFGGVTRSAP